jgi:hypothetical protein
LNYPYKKLELENLVTLYQRKIKIIELDFDKVLLDDKGILENNELYCFSLIVNCVFLLWGGGRMGRGWAGFYSSPETVVVFPVWDGPSLTIASAAGLILLPFRLRREQVCCSMLYSSWLDQLLCLD